MLMTTNNPSMILQKQQQGNDLHPQQCQTDRGEAEDAKKIHLVLTLGLEKGSIYFINWLFLF